MGSGDKAGKSSADTFTIKICRIIPNGKWRPYYILASSARVTPSDNTQWEVETCGTRAWTYRDCTGRIIPNGKWRHEAMVSCMETAEAQSDNTQWEVETPYSSANSRMASASRKIPNGKWGIWWGCGITYLGRYGKGSFVGVGLCWFDTS